MKYQDLMQVVNAVKSMNSKEINLIIDAIKQNQKRSSVLSSTKFHEVRELCLVKWIVGYKE